MRDDEYSCEMPPGLEQPDYWREVIADLYGPPRPNGFVAAGGIAGTVRDVIGQGARLQCDYHGNQHVTFPIGRACLWCIREHEEDEKEMPE